MTATEISETDVTDTEPYTTEAYTTEAPSASEVEPEPDAGDKVGRHAWDFSPSLLL